MRLFLQTFWKLLCEVLSQDYWVERIYDWEQRLEAYNSSSDITENDLYQMYEYGQITANELYESLVTDIGLSHMDAREMVRLEYELKIALGKENGNDHILPGMAKGSTRGVRRAAEHGKNSKGS